MTLIDGFLRDFWRYWSVQVSFFWAGLMGWVTADPKNQKELIALLPDPLEPVGNIILGVTVAASLLAARGVAQTKLTK